jgi:type II secretory ATPase GspE/PulE/Tfp pilus assembly ATPase PilB-like protein
VRELQEAGRIPSRILLKAGFVEPEDLDGNWKPYRAVGCSACNNGYKGRVGIYQVMPITEAIQRIILSEGTALDIAKQAQRKACATCASPAWSRCAAASPRSKK